jgi:hypothetical protein
MLKIFLAKHPRKYRIKNLFKSKCARTPHLNTRFINFQKHNQIYNIDPTHKYKK